MPIHVSTGLGTEGEPIEALQTAIRKAKTSLGAKKIDLAIVFSTIEFSHPALLKTITNMLGNSPLVGCASTGIILGSGIYKYGIVIMLLSLPENVYYNTACVKQIDTKTTVSAGSELGEKLLYGFKNIRKDLGIIFSDGLIKNESGFIEGLQEKLGQSFPLTGTCVTDNLTFKKTCLYFNGESLNNAVCGILLGGKLNFGLGIKHGWKPLGKPRYVTKSTGNVVNEIDNRPAAEIYKEYLEFDLNKLKKELKRISVLYPIGISLPGEDEYLLRNIISIGEDESLTFHGDVPRDCAIRLMIGTKESCLSATNQAIEEVKKGLSGKACDFLMVFNSISRNILLGRQAAKELEVIQEKFGSNTPIIGLFSYGEKAPLKSINYHGKTYFHNQAISMLGIGG